jgi:hypothetical protein
VSHTWSVNTHIEGIAWAKPANRTLFHDQRAGNGVVFLARN